METLLFVPKVQELAESDHNYCQLKADNEKLYELCQCQSWPNKQRNFSIYCRYICGTVSTPENFEQQSISFQFSQQLFKSFIFISDEILSSPDSNSDSLASDGVLFQGSLPTPTGASIHQSVAFPFLFPGLYQGKSTKKRIFYGQADRRVEHIKTVLGPFSVVKFVIFDQGQGRGGLTVSLTVKFPFFLQLP